MTHYLRSEHDAILVGIGTVLADNPKLNCRYNGGNSPIPVVIDPLCQWEYAKSQLHQICESGQGRAPIIIIDDKSMPSQDNERILGLQGGRYLKLPLLSNRTNNWSIILDVLYELGIKSVMVEGGAKIINELLAYKEPIIDSLIITIGPVFLGNEGVEVSPSRHVDLSNVKWWSGIQDSIMCASVEH
ncbi:2,5-diamino-6-(ribosylamino)-4(3H)-pyrimidinone 5'-phosphate reductase [Yamadazyma tenuis]|nr:2,5-diamino-6-(ribosylamino)-4(3H)-pyrimidinone 5'-phosphate reductase [Yamadazyma tenuis]